MIRLDIRSLLQDAAIEEVRFVRSKNEQIQSYAAEQKLLILQSAEESWLLGQGLTTGFCMAGYKQIIHLCFFTVVYLYSKA